MKVTAIATRSGGWWAVEVPEVPGLLTQAKRLDQIPEMVADAAQFFDLDDVEVEVRADIPEDIAALVQLAKSRRAELREVEAEAATASREAVARLRFHGLPVRDVATLLEVSPQRVSQLESDTKTRATA